MTNICSLRQHDLDQVLRVERATLLSARIAGHPVQLLVINILEFLRLSIQKHAAAARTAACTSACIYRTRRLHSSFICNSRGLHA